MKFKSEPFLHYAEKLSERQLFVVTNELREAFRSINLLDDHIQASVNAVAFALRTLADHKAFINMKDTDIESLMICGITEKLLIQVHADHCVSITDLLKDI